MHDWNAAEGFLDAAEGNRSHQPLPTLSLGEVMVKANSMDPKGFPSFLRADVATGSACDGYLGDVGNPTVQGARPSSQRALRPVATHDGPPFDAVICNR